MSRRRCRLSRRRLCPQAGRSRIVGNHHGARSAPDFGRWGGPERKLRGRPPSPVEPRSGPWRRTGSESGAGRARTRHPL